MPDISAAMVAAAALTVTSVVLGTFGLLVCNLRGAPRFRFDKNPVIGPLDLASDR